MPGSTNPDFDLFCPITRNDKPAVEWILVDKSGYSSKKRPSKHESSAEMVEPVLMGHAPAKVDDKGRLKIPANFRKVIEEKFGSDCFITSTDGERALIYPMPVWFDFQGRLSKVPSTSMAKAKLLEKVNYFGQTGTIDTQGRVLIPSILRTVAGIAEDVVVIGNTDHLIVWNGEKIQQRMAETPLTNDAWKELELHGV